MLHRSTWKRALLGLLLGVAPILLSGCGVGILIVGGVVAGVLLSKDGGGSGSTPVGTPVLVAPERQTLRAGGNAFEVPICLQSGGLGVGRLKVDYARQSEGFEVWHGATRTAAGTRVSPCADFETFWWDGVRDLELGADASELVRVRVFDEQKPDKISTSGPFFVGNTAPNVEIFGPSEDRPSGELTVRFLARDAEGDPLRDVRLFYELPATGENATDEKLIEHFDRLSAEAETGTLHPVSWNTEDATGLHNVRGVRVRLQCSDDFGLAVEKEIRIDVFNNTRPEARFAGSARDLDASFEVPVPFLLDDADSQGVAVVVQWARTGADFPALCVEPSGDPGCRYEDIDPSRREELQIATPSSRSVLGSVTEGLASSPSGLAHTFVWNSAADVAPAGVTSVRLRITPFDEEQGVADETEAFSVRNDVFPSQRVLAAGHGIVGGTAVGDLDGDGHADAVASLPAATSLPPEANPCPGDVGRVDIFFRDPDGSLSESPFSVLPGPLAPAGPCGSGVQRVPTDVRILDLDGDGRNDLLVLGSNCRENNCGDARGVISLFFGSPEGGVSRRPQVLLEAGADSRSLGVGDFDGDGRLDLAVSNHQVLLQPREVPRSVGIFRQTGARSFHSMEIFSDCKSGETEECEPGLLVCADFTGDGKDDIAFREDEPAKNRVLILRYIDGALDVWASLQLSARDEDFLNFLPVSLAVFDDDGDSVPDLAVGSRGASAVFTFLNHGAQDFNRRSKTCLNSSPERLALADITRDGRLDFIGLEPGLLGGAFEIAERATEGSCCPEACAFHQILASVPSTSEIPAPAFAADDLNGDGLPDLLLPTTDGAQLHIAQGPGTPARDRERSIPISVFFSLEDLSVADYNGDGLDDIAVVVSPESRADPHHEVWLFFQSRLGRFADAPNAVLRNRPGNACARTYQKSPAFIAEGDLNSDGACDTVAISREGGVDLFWRGPVGFSAEPSGSFEDCQNPPILQGSPIAFGDFDGVDGPDLLRLDAYGDLQSSSGRVLLFNLEEPNSSHPGRVQIQGATPLLTSSFPLSMAARDFDGDELSDLAIYLGISGAIQVLRQEPGGPWPERFQEASVLQGEPASAVLGVEDFDADGLLDIFLNPSTSPRIHVFLQQPAGGAEKAMRFKKIAELEPGAIPSAVAAADFNGDGRPDVAAAAAGESNVRLFYQRAGGGFAASPSWTIELDEALSGEARMIARDVTNDSRPDIILLDKGGHAVRILEAR